MKAVVDTNVIAYFLLGTPRFAPEAREFWHRAGELLAPALWEAETATVVWMAVRSRVLHEREASAKLALASRLGIRSVSSRTLWHGALTRAVQSKVSVYDTLYVELADREGLPLATFDARILGAFPAIASRPCDLV